MGRYEMPGCAEALVYLKEGRDRGDADDADLDELLDALVAAYTAMGRAPLFEEEGA